VGELRWVLTDMAEAHYQTPDGWFLPAGDGVCVADRVTCFATLDEAEEAVRRWRRRGCHVKAVLALCAG
jgi:hypothetical protein